MEAAMSSLLVLSAVGNLGRKGVIMVIHHTDCGLGSINDEEIRDALLGSLDRGLEEEGRGLVEGMKFGGIER